MRKPDPERIYLARRAAILSILTGCGASVECAEAQVVAWEAEVVARGLPRHESSWWDDAVERIAERRRGLRHAPLIQAAGIARIARTACPAQEILRSLRTVPRPAMRRPDVHAVP